MSAEFQKVAAVLERLRGMIGVHDVHLPDPWFIDGEVLEAARSLNDIRRQLARARAEAAVRPHCPVLQLDRPKAFQGHLSASYRAGFEKGWKGLPLYCPYSADFYKNAFEQGWRRGRQDVEAQIEQAMEAELNGTVEQMEEARV